MEDIIIRIKGDPKDIDNLTKSLHKVGAVDDANAKQFKQHNEEFKKQGKEKEQSLGVLNDQIKNIGKTIVAAFSVAAIVGFTKEIISVRAEFEKYEAVLKNTLGSADEAALAIAQIQKFAAATPFSIKELTESFVKLVNQGFKPTMSEMTNLGDVAASQGKSFDMLAEAIIDAQTGEFERLKEFGIRATKQGDQVKFAFKGVETQVKFTSESIREYIVGLGKAEGVSGSMEAISKTLGGQISNLGDAYDGLLNTLGKSSGTVFSGIITRMSETLNLIAQGFKSIKQIKEEAQLLAKATASTEEVKQFQEFIDKRKLATGAAFDLKKETESYIKTLDKEILRLDQLWKTQLDPTNTQKQQEIVKAEKKAVEDYIIQLQKKDNADKGGIGTVKELRQEIEKKKKSLEDANIANGESIKIARELVALEDKLKRALGEETEADKKAAEKNKKLAELSKENLLSQADVSDQVTRAIESDLKEVYDLKIDTSANELENIKHNSAAEINLAKEKKAALIKLEELTASEKKLIQQAAQDFGLSLIGDLAAINQNISDQEIINLQTQLDKKQITQEQYDQKSKSIKRKAAEEAKAFAIFQTIINTAQAVMAALGNPVPFVGQTLAVLAAATGAAELAVIASQPIPQFAKGTEYLKRGNNKPGKDTILLWGNEGEAIIQTEKNAERPGMAAAWNRGNLDQYIHVNYVIPAMKLNRPDPIDYGRLAREIVINQKAFNDGNLLESDRLSRSLLREQTSVLKDIRESKSYPGRY